MQNKLPDSWKTFLGADGTSPLKKVEAFLENEWAAGKQIYPSRENIFRAFALTKPEDVKVVILGQDPYHGEGQAHGLSFSVPDGVKVPPSLRNIFKGLLADLTPQRFSAPKSGDLTKWARDGVLLLNAVLTVEAGNAGSHARKGWEDFTDKVIEKISLQRSGVVFMLWGNYAKEKARLIDEKKHKILTSSHPSPLSVRHGFLTSKAFSQANGYLESIGEAPIDWSLC